MENAVVMWWENLSPEVVTAHTSTRAFQTELGRPSFPSLQAIHYSWPDLLRRGKSAEQERASRTCMLNLNKVTDC